MSSFVLNDYAHYDLTPANCKEERFLEFNNAEAGCMLCHNAIEARETMQNSVG